MWTPTTRRLHSREGLRYETDLTDAEWAVIEPLLPAPSKRGRPLKWREKANGAALSGHVVKRRRSLHDG